MYISYHLCNFWQILHLCVFSGSWMQWIRQKISSHIIGLIMWCDCAGYIRLLRCAFILVYAMCTSRLAWFLKQHLSSRQYHGARLKLASPTVKITYAHMLSSAQDFVILSVLYLWSGVIKWSDIINVWCPTIISGSEWSSEKASQGSTWCYLHAVRCVLEAFQGKLQDERICWFTVNQNVVWIIQQGSGNLLYK